MEAAEILTREQSAEWLNSHGYVARPRDWVMGKTVCVLAGEQPPTNLGFKLYHHCLYIHPLEQGWAVTDLAQKGLRPTPCKTLAAATVEAHRVLTAKLA